MSAVRNYILVTLAYWAFTLTDGALRMLVLLHFHGLGYSPVDLAFLFLFYEFFGVVTNLLGGYIAARLGLRVTLFSGLLLQVLAKLRHLAWVFDAVIKIHPRQKQALQLGGVWMPEIAHHFEAELLQLPDQRVGPRFVADDQVTLCE